MTCWDFKISLMKLHTQIHAYMPTYINKYIHIYIHTYLHTYTRTYVHTYIRTYVHTYIQGVAIKKPDSCSNPLLKKIRQSKCYPLQCSPLPDPYTAACEFSTVGSSAAGHLVLCCSRVASLLLSLHPRTQTWFL